MKQLLATIFFQFILVIPGALANHYYFSTTDGDDSRTSTQAQNPATPWKTLGKLNAIFSSLQPGDVVCFKKGDVFYGGITVSRSGSSTSPITFGTYGAGAKPIITGGTAPASWKTIGNNLWETSAAVSTLSSCNLVSVHGANTAMGRWPNNGFRSISSADGTESITDNTLPSSSVFTGGQVVIRNNHWTLSRNTITNQSGTTILYSATTDYKGQPGWGYFVENHFSTLDAQDEWYYNPSSKKLDIYSASSPTGVVIPTVDILVNFSSHSYLSFSNLQFQFANSDIVKGSGSHINISDCDLRYAGHNAITSSGTNLTVQNCTILNINSQAITAGSANGFTAGTGSGLTVTGCLIRNIGTLPGMADSGSNGYRSRNGICADGDDVRISQNTIDSTGYGCILFGGDNVVISKNLLMHAAMVTDDVGAIYTWNNPNHSETPPAKSNRVVSQNIVLDVLGTGGGVGDDANLGAGIYCDDGANNVTIINNSVAGVPRQGIFLHNAARITVVGNTVFDCQYTAMGFQQDDLSVQNVAENVIRQNIFFAKTGDQFCWLYSQHDVWPIESLGEEDSNYFARPVNEPSFFQVSGTTKTLAQWKSQHGLDRHSKNSSVAISDPRKIRFEYNATSENKTISLDGAYADARGRKYSGSITLEPYTSAVLINITPFNHRP